MTDLTYVEKIETLKKWARARTDFFLSKMLETDDPFELEALCYCVKSVAEHAKEQFHIIHEMT